MSRLATFPYRLRKRLAREIRSRAMGSDVGLDRWAYRRRCRKGNPKDLFLAAARWAPWRGTDDLDFVTSAEREAIIAKADQACRHEFDLLGSGPTDLGEEIDWHLDFKSGFRWDTAVHYSRIKWDAAPSGVDIKVPWELSRCMHFATLGLADRLSGDGKYYAEFKRQVRHWIAENPVGRGVNWFCAMDVALRAVNWINAAMLFHHRIEDDPDEAFFSELAEALWMAGLHISRNLEWDGPKSDRTGNHFLSDLTGLLGLGLLFGNTRIGSGWLRFSRCWIEREMQRQVNPDGSNCESSTSYHRLVMEMFLWADAVCGAVGNPFSRDYRDRLRCMADFVVAYTAPSGMAAQFGDNDSGRVLACGIGDPGDHRYLITADAGNGGAIDRWLLCGDILSFTTVNTCDGAFRDGGYWVMKTREAWIGVRAGPFSFRGAHAHCDQLSFVLAVEGEDFILDPGTGVYSSDVAKRNRYRSASMHNACRINQWEPNATHDGRIGLFQMNDDTMTEVLDWHRDGDDSFFAGRHHGYERFRKGLGYERSLVLRSDRLEIRDRVERLEVGDRLDWSFHFAPGVELVMQDGAVVACSGTCRIRIVPDTRIELEIADSCHSPAYGVELRAIKLMMGAVVSEPGCGDYRIKIEWELSDGMSA